MMFLLAAVPLAIAAGYLGFIVLTLLWRLNLMLTLRAKLQEEAYLHVNSTALAQQARFHRKLLEQLSSPNERIHFFQAKPVERLWE
jgi:hypothetical protein